MCRQWARWKSGRGRQGDTLEAAIASATLGLGGGRQGDTLETAISSASLGLLQDEQRLVTDLQRDSPKPAESLPFGVPYDNPAKEVLTKELALTMDREATKRQIEAFQEAAAQIRGKRNKDSLPSVTRILNETMPQESRMALQVS